MTERQMLPGCPYAKKCGGCQLQNLSYPEQLKWKQAQVRRLLGKFHQVETHFGNGESPLPLPQQSAGRFGVTRDRRIVSESINLAATASCRWTAAEIEDSKADAIIVTVRELLRSFKLTAYDERRGAGLSSPCSGETRIFYGGDHGGAGDIYPRYFRQTPFYSGAACLASGHHDGADECQSPRTSPVLGNGKKSLYGKGYIEDVLCGCQFGYLPARFLSKINPVQTEQLYQKAVELAGLTGVETSH